MRMAGLVAWGGAVVVVAGLACAAALGAGSSPNPWVDVALSAATLLSAAVGLLLVVRARADLIGGLLMANALALVAIGCGDAYARRALDTAGSLPGAEWAAVLADRTWPLLFVPVAAIAWVYPTGRLPSARWRPWAVAGAVSVAGFITATLLRDEPFTGDLARLQNPMPSPSGPWVGAVQAITAVGAAAAVVAGVVIVGRRFRRAQGIERLQLVWLAYGAALIPVVVAVCLAEAVLVGHDGIATAVALTVVLTAIPAAIGIALLRYRVYDIGTLVNRTVVYGFVSAGVAAVFAGVALMLGAVAGAGSTAATAGATLAATLAVAPLRARFQSAVDRRIDRARYDGRRAVQGFLEDLRNGDAEPEAIERVLARALDDPELQMRFAMGAGERDVDVHGRPVEEEPPAGRAVTPVRRGERMLGRLVHAPALLERPDLLDTVVGASGLAIEMCRLRVEVRRHLTEVEASRARLVAAGDEERRRLERDLHDGAQQRLVSIGLGLRHVQAGLAAGSPAAVGIDTAVTELAEAIDELRELARGVRPAGLNDGLGRALRELAGRSHVPTDVEVTGERFPQGLEAAAYFVASEALANAAKHARATRVVMRAAREDGQLRVSVRDDGIGGASVRAGSGLAGIADRVAALGGRVTVTSPAGEGTLVTAELPCAS